MPAAQSNNSYTFTSLTCVIIIGSSKVMLSPDCAGRLRVDIMETDFTLILRARDGDEGAYRFIVQRHMGLIRRKARSFFLCGGTQDDLVQEGLIGLCKAIRDFDPEQGASFRTFADLCVTRHLITAVKAASRQKHGPLNSSVSLEGSPFMEGDGEARLGDILSAGPDIDPLNQVIANDVVENLVDNLLAMLSGFESEVLSLYLKEKSYVEIAEELGRDTKSVDNAIQRIRRKFNLLTSHE